MKKQMLTTLMVLTLAIPAMAMNHGKMSGGMDHGNMAAQGAMDAGARKGQMIHQATVEGYQLAYHLIDMKEHMESMKDMPGMAAMKDMDMSQMKSHHLMVYIVGADGKAVTDAKVGYMVTGPDSEVAKTMAMAMIGGYGADVDYKVKGAYEIKLKAVAGETQLVDKFTYEVK